MGAKMRRDGEDDVHRGPIMPAPPASWPTIVMSIPTTEAPNTTDRSPCSPPW